MHFFFKTSGKFPIMEVNDVLCFDMWLEIANLNSSAFAAVTSINRDIRNYTNEHIQKYKKKFSIEIKEDSGGIKGKYFQLPNGDKHGLYQSWYEGGSPYANMTYIDGKLEGHVQSWYENRQLREEGFFHEGKLEGLFQIWCEDGELCEEITFNNGFMHGVYQRWYGNDKLNIRCNYDNDKLHGLYQTFHIEGSSQLWEQYNWTNGVPTGLYQRWNNNGQLEIECVLESDSVLPLKVHKIHLNHEV